MAASIQVVSPEEFPIEIVKWKVKKDSMVMKGSVLALYKVQNRSQIKLKSTATGIVDEILVEAGMKSDPGTVLVTLRQQELGGCTHSTVMKDMCADCGADLRREPGLGPDRKEVMSASVAMVHNIPELIVSQEQALELGREDEQRLLKTRKLVLLVDLDQTLIHTTNDNIPPHLKDVYHFQMGQGPHASWYHTKFRPFTRRFLEHVSELYELHICTFGVRLYAHTVARLIDPDEKFFSHRILSRDECFDPLSKTANLKALFPCGDAMVCIIDDREDVWNRAPNLVHVKPYRFFQGTADINAPPGLDKTENDNIPMVHRVIDQHGNKSNTRGNSVGQGCVGGQLNESDGTAVVATLSSEAQRQERKYARFQEKQEAMKNEKGAEMHQDKVGEELHQDTVDKKVHQHTVGEEVHQDTVGEDVHQEIAGEERHQDTVGEEVHQNTVGEDVPRDTAGEDRHQDTVGEEVHQDTVSEKRHQDTVGEEVHQDTVSEERHQDTVGEEVHQDTVGEEVHQDTVSEERHQDIVSEERHQDTLVEEMRQDTLGEKMHQGTVGEEMSQDTLSEEMHQGTVGTEVCQDRVSTEEEQSSSDIVTEPQHSLRAARISDVSRDIGCNPDSDDMGVQQREVTSEEQLAQDLCISSDSDSDYGDMSDNEGAKLEAGNDMMESTPVYMGDCSDSDEDTTGAHCTYTTQRRDKESIEKQEKEDLSTGKKTGSKTTGCVPEARNTQHKENKATADEGTRSKPTCSLLKNQDEGKHVLVSKVAAKESVDASNNSGEVEWDDDDDYLLYLEEILTRIHKAFYSMVDERCQDPNPPSSKPATSVVPLPDLKSLIPYVKRKTLKGCNIVFSGLVPLNTAPEKSRAYIVARALGATVQQDIIGAKHTGKKRHATTHLVAAKPGTGKHKTALRTWGVHIVSSAWLWACEERWEHCDEHLFPLESRPHTLESDTSPAPQKRGKKRPNRQAQVKHKANIKERDKHRTHKEFTKRRKTHTTICTEVDNISEENRDQLSDGEMSHSSEKSAESFADTVHPLLAFSDEDLECMDKEVDELMAEEATGSEDETDDERDERYRNTVLGLQNDSGSSSDSLSGEFPRGWGVHHKLRSSPRASDDDLQQQQHKEVEAETEDTENELYRFQKAVETFSPDTDTNTSFAESVGSVDDEIADAVEKEFLASL